MVVVLATVVVVLATVVVVLVVVLLACLRRQRARLGAILNLVAAEATELVGALCMEFTDFATDVLVCYKILRGDVPVPRSIYKNCYVGLTCFGAVAFVCSVGYRLRNAHLVRKYVRENGQLEQALSRDAPETAARRATTTRLDLQRSESSSRVAGVAGVHERALQHLEFELAQLRRSRVLAALTLMTAAVEGACIPYF